MLSYCHACLSPAIVIIAIRDDHVASYNIVSQNQPPFLWIACPSWAESTLFEGKEATLDQTNIGSYSSLAMETLRIDRGNDSSIDSYAVKYFIYIVAIASYCTL